MRLVAGRLQVLFYAKIERAKEDMNSFLYKLFYATGCVFELARGVIIFAVILALVNVFVVTANLVSGASMEPNFHSGEYVIINKWSYLVRTPLRGEVVVLRFPGDPEKVRYIKRVIGLPGETIKIQDNQIFINSQRVNESAYVPVTTETAPNLERRLGPDEYFLMGDNRENSNDSRVFGPVERRFIFGSAFMVIWPIKYAGLVIPQFYILDDQKTPEFVTQ